jgi:hypothetical protein
MQILSEIQSLTQMLFSYPFAMNLITLIEIILFFSPSPTISQISYFLPSNTAFKMTNFIILSVILNMKAKGVVGTYKQRFWIEKKHLEISEVEWDLRSIRMSRRKTDY